MLDGRFEFIMVSCRQSDEGILSKRHIRCHKSTFIDPLLRRLRVIRQSLPCEAARFTKATIPSCILILLTKAVLEHHGLKATSTFMLIGDIMFCTVCAHRKGLLHWRLVEVF
jgi:hypothetical protein